MNPLFPREFFIPDGEARKMPDGRLYVYGSSDMPEEPQYCSNRYYVFSTQDCQEWVNHGIAFSAGMEENSVLKEPVTLGGPDCVEKDGKYYLFYCTSRTGEGVAEAETPYGPFHDPSPIPFADGDSIDPAAFVDDNGDAYYFWGQFHLKGAKLKKNMRKLDMDTFHDNIITEQQHGFHEGASMRKRNGLYYLIYTDITRGRATCLSYAMSKSPFGPFEKKGVIIDNTGCDPSSWNNHGSIEEINGQWYIFYHRSSQNSIANRRMCAEPVFFREDGTIAEVEMTSQGSSAPIDAAARIDASIACRLRKPFYFSEEPPIRIAPEPGHGEIITMTKKEDWAEYKYLDFKAGAARFTVSASSQKKCYLEIMVEEGRVIGICTIENTGSFHQFREFSCELTEKITGVHAVWLNFKQAEGEYGRLADVDWFTFA
ncbi:family 43 glycosylhydrolase [Eisenbergiella porci]|uniref:family 43 glycosylhydrolase n=1 Tax=Eisenbergiella porci TaxID=2652274 RepID=UPI003AB81B8A